MTNEEKQLLLKDLCARLPYGVICNLYDVEDANKKFKLNELSNLIISAINSGCIKPYLRPMSNMTEEEEAFIYNGHIEFWIREDYCNKHYLDYRGLIPMGLAIEATESMYETE